MPPNTFPPPPPPDRLGGSSSMPPVLHCLSAGIVKQVCCRGSCRVSVAGLSLCRCNLPPSASPRWCFQVGGGKPLEGAMCSLPLGIGQCGYYLCACVDGWRLFWCPVAFVCLCVSPGEFNVVVRRRECFVDLWTRQLFRSLVQVILYC